VHHNPWVALDATTDRRRLAGDLARAHFEHLSGGKLSPLIRRVIERSWRRSSDAGVDPDHGIAPRSMPAEAALDRWERHPLYGSVPLLRELLADVRDDAQQVVLVCDADGTLLWIDGEPAVLDAAHGINLAPGAVWAEADAGTNAMGTALATRHPVQVFSAEHFAAPVHEWTCAAAPVRDPDNGETLGVIDLSGELSTAHPHSLALVSAAARMIELDLRRRALEPRNTVSVTARCAPELLVLGRDRAVLVRGGDRIELTPRHSEILVVLCGHPEGLSAEQLALELYGESGKPVSIRAELSRLRRIVGDRLKANPYRMEPPLRTDFAADPPGHGYAGSLLPASEVEAVRELRDAHDETARAAALEADDVEALAGWLDTPAGAQDIEAVRRLVALLSDSDRRRPAAVSRLQRLARA
jgi:hypothetical protein